MGPTWNCNYLRLPKGCRPAILTYTPVNYDTGAGRLDLDVVLHEGGAVAAWAQGAAPGDPAAISGPGRGYEIDPAVTSYVLAGDEAALPAIGHLLEHLPASVEVQVLAEVASPDARIELPAHRGATITWLDLPPGAPAGDALVAAVAAAEIPADAHVWAAGEAAAVQRMRKHLFEERSEEQTSELQSLMRISYAVFCLKKKNKNYTHKSK